MLTRKVWHDPESSYCKSQWDQVTINAKISWNSYCASTGLGIIRVTTTLCGGFYAYAGRAQLAPREKRKRMKNQWAYVFRKLPFLFHKFRIFMQSSALFVVIVFSERPGTSTEPLSSRAVWHLREWPWLFGGGGGTEAPELIISSPAYCIYCTLPARKFLRQFIQNTKQFELKRYVAELKNTLFILILTAAPYLLLTELRRSVEPSSSVE